MENNEFIIYHMMVCIFYKEDGIEGRSDLQERSVA